MADKDITLMQVDGGNKWLPATVTPVANALLSFDASKVPQSIDALLVSASAVTIKDTVNVVLSTGTGTKIGTAVGQKLGFWNATPIVQPVGAAQGALTDSSGGSGSTVPLIGDTTAVNQATNLNNAHFAIVTLLHAIRTALVNAGIIKGAA